MSIGTVPLLLVHGVGSHPPDRIRDQVKGALESRLGSIRLEPREYNWNEALGKLSLIRGWSFEEIGRLGVAVRNAARIGFEEGPPSRWKRLLNLLWALQTPLWIAWLLLLLWFFVSNRAAAALPAEAPLAIGVPPSWLLLPPVPADLLASTAPLAALVAKWGLVGIVAYPLALALLDGLTGTRPWPVVARRALLSLAWPVIYVLSFLPLIVILGGLVWMFVLAAGCLVDPEQTLGLADSVFDLPVALGTVGRGLRNMLAAVLISGFLSLATRGAFKVLGDIFLYLGNTAYREALHSELLAAVRGLGDASRVVIAAHSLGSVIVADSLLDRTDEWRRLGSIELITMGSPLRRVFSRFFPSAYPPPDEIAGGLAERYASFRWTNIYRRLDYVGAALSGSGAIADRRVRSGWRLHTGYWSDTAVIDFATSVLSHPPGRVNEVSGVAAEPYASRLRFRPFAVPALSKVVILSLVLPGLPAIFWTQCGYVPAVEARTWTHWQEALDSAAAEERGVARLEGGGWRALFGTRVAVAWPRDDPDRTVLSGHRYPHIDWRAVRSALADSGAPSLAVDVRHVPDGRIFDLPDYRRQPRTPRWPFYLLQIWRGAILWIVWIVLVALVPYLILSSWVGEGDFAARAADSAANLPLTDS